MPQSALLGSPPATRDDTLIRIGLKASVGSIFNPNPLLPYGPPRPSPDLSGESNASKVMATEIVCLILIMSVTLGRFWARSRLKSWSFGLDDLMAIPACLCGIGYISSIIAFTGPCYGRHMWLCTYEQIEAIYVTLEAGTVVFYFGVYCAKVSIVFLYRRITASTSRGWKWVHWTVLSIIVSCGLVSVFGTAFSCIPAPSHFSFVALAQTDPKSLHCIDYNSFQIALRGLHIGTDLMLLSFPLIVLYRLQMPTRKKFAIGWVFCFGIVCCISSVMRNVVYEKPSEDFTYDSYNLVVWDTIDFSFAIMVASLPAFYRPLDAAFRYMHELVGSRISRSRHSTGKNYKSSVRTWIGSTNHTTSSNSNDPRNDKDKEGGQDILLSSASHMGWDHRRGLGDGQRTSMWQNPKSEDVELAHMKLEERV